MEGPSTRVIGIDLAKRTYVAQCIEPGQAKPAVWQGKTDAEGIRRLMGRIRETDRVGLEACAFGFYLAKMLLVTVKCHVVVLNPGDLHVIFRSIKKTDLEDAGKLALLLNRMTDEELPVVHLPTEQEEKRRCLISELQYYKGIRTSLVNRLHSILVRAGWVDAKKSEMKTSKGRKEWLKKLTGHDANEAQRLMAQIILSESLIGALELEIVEELKNDETAQRLMSIPGVGVATAMAFLAHVGDGSRFRTAAQVANFVGMTPVVDSSGETNKLGRISKRGCHALRSIIVQSAWACVLAKKDHFLKHKYEDLVVRRGKIRAIVAIARKILELMWVLSIKKEIYRDTNAKELTLKLRRLKVA